MAPTNFSSSSPMFVVSRSKYAGDGFLNRRSCSCNPALHHADLVLAAAPIASRGGLQSTGLTFVSAHMSGFLSCRRWPSLGGKTSREHACRGSAVSGVGSPVGNGAGAVQHAHDDLLERNHPSGQGRSPQPLLFSQFTASLAGFINSFSTAEFASGVRAL